MTGRVENRHVLVPITFRLPGQPDLTIEIVVDTGFTEDLTLPPPAIAAMHLPFAYDLTVNLANDADVEVPVHYARILWQGNEQDVRIFATGRRPLLGTALLDGNELLVQFAENGLVTINGL
ncbi:MAG TPA: clan AA aspartic protease [Chthonomonadaceae bacterium]|nr:clan AA aspartic protease [Chthonomonadaceae bacterium]